MGFLPEAVAARLDSFPRHLLPLVYLLCLLPVFASFYIERRRQQDLRGNVPGCKRLGLSGRSNLSDERSPGRSTPRQAQVSSAGGGEPWRIKALFIHPIKSCAPVELDVADLSSSGLAWDRQFCFASWMVPKNFPPDFSDSDKKKPRWVFCSLRLLGLENLVHVRPEVWVPDPDFETSTGQKNPHPNGLLVINYPNIKPRGSLLSRLTLRLGQSLHLVPRETSFRVPLVPPPHHTYPVEQVSIWKELPLAVNYGQHIPAAFKTYLNIPADKPFTLFRASPHQTRNVFRNAPRMGTEEGQVPYQPTIAFADSYPIHLLNISSIRDVAGKADVAATIPAFTARRFRPNIVVAGPKPYDEDDWKRIRVTRQLSGAQNTSQTLPVSETPASPDPQPVDFHCAAHTIRCKLPNVDPDTGVRHPSQPDKTLRSFRCIDAGDPNKAAMGLQLVAATASDGVRVAEEGKEEREGGYGSRNQLEVGNCIEVLERGELVYTKR